LAGAITLVSKGFDAETADVNPLFYDDLNARIAGLPDNIWEH